MLKGVANAFNKIEISQRRKEITSKRAAPLVSFHINLTVLEITIAAATRTPQICIFDE